MYRDSKFHTSNLHITLTVHPYLKFFLYYLLSQSTCNKGRPYETVIIFSKVNFDYCCWIITWSYSAFLPCIITWSSIFLPCIITWYLYLALVVSIDPGQDKDEEDKGEEGRAQATATNYIKNEIFFGSLINVLLGAKGFTY